MPMIGLILSFFAFSWNSHAACMLPWSVMASAGCSNSRARRMRSSIRLAPSRSEYSEWQCRCTKDIGLKNSAGAPALSKRRGGRLVTVNRGLAIIWTQWAGDGPRRRTALGALGAGLLALATALACGGGDPTEPLPLYTVTPIGGIQLAAPSGSELLQPI